MSDRYWLSKNLDCHARGFGVRSISTPQDGIRGRVDVNWRIAPDPLNAPRGVMPDIGRSPDVPRCAADHVTWPAPLGGASCSGSLEDSMPSAARSRWRKWLPPTAPGAFGTFRLEHVGPDAARARGALLHAR